MKTFSYTDILNETIKRYVNGDYKGAYTFITEEAPKVVTNLAQIYNFRYAIASKMGDVELSIKLFKEAVEDHEFWYSYEYLMEDDDLEPIRNKPVFKELANTCKEREISAKKSTQAKLKVIEPKENEDTNQLLIGLHGNQENIEVVEEYWTSQEFNGYTVALPQSSEIEFATGYVWEDIEQGAKELKAHYAQLTALKATPYSQVTIGAFSAGADVALEALVRGYIRANRLILIAPWFADLDRLSNNMAKLKELGVLIYMVCGDADEDCFESTDAFAELLDDHEIPYEFAIIEGLDHTYPRPFNSVLNHCFSYFKHFNEDVD